ncbi:MAG: sensor histidine kinase [Candidatus Electrothrix sp. AR3]|nr:sensor histidine kinase [Candidatus Electrothrix sp. AR3]
MWINYQRVDVQCIKHAFSERKQGRIDIQFQQNKASDFIFMISDDGIGLPQDFETKKKSSMGLQLIFRLTDQLDGNIDILNEDNQGTTFKITFPAA